MASPHNSSDLDAGEGNRGHALLVLHADDNTAVALRDLAQGDTADAEGGRAVTVAESIPAGHKLALTRIEANGVVRKYGVAIGTADVAIEPGRYVHVHNVHSERMRGDR